MVDKQIGAWPFVQAVTDFLFLDHVPEKADVIFIPGSRHLGHTLRAAALYREGYAPYVLPSGLHGYAQAQFCGVLPEDKAEYPGTYNSEWAYMKAVLLHHGVPDSAILREDEATFTWDNARKSAAVLQANGIAPSTAILCCRPFHARRALLYYQTAFPQTRFLVCPGKEAGCDRDDWYLSAQGREKILGELRRLGSQIAPQFDELCQKTDNFLPLQG